jgi:hypothetical protein
MDVCREKSPRELAIAGHAVRCHAVDQDLVRLGEDPQKLSDSIAQQVAAKGQPKAKGKLEAASQG